MNLPPDVVVKCTRAAFVGGNIDPDRFKAMALNLGWVQTDEGDHGSWEKVATVFPALAPVVNALLGGADDDS